MEQIWSYVGVISSVAGVVLYPMSSAFKEVFGEWSSLKICLYSLFSFIICGTTFYVMFLATTWPLPTGLKNFLLKGKSHLSFGAVTAISVYSFFSHKKVSEKPDILSLLSCVAFAVTFFSLSRKLQHGPEVELLFFCLELFITDLMEIKWLLVLAVGGLIHILIVLFSFFSRRHQPVIANLDPIPQNQLAIANLDPATQNQPVIAVGLPVDDVDYIFKTLTNFAEVIRQNNYDSGNLGRFLKEADAGMKVAPRFIEALTHRINPQPLEFPSFYDQDFYESFVYFRFAHVTANGAILEELKKSTDAKSTHEVSVHVIDLGLEQVIQWIKLLEESQASPNLPKLKSFRLSGICLPQRYNAQHMEKEIEKLRKVAERGEIEFDCRRYSWEELDEIKIEDGEIVVVNSLFELHRIHTGTTSMNIEEALEKIKNFKPKIMIMVEQEANHNGTSFVERLQEAFPYYRDVFDSLDGSLTKSSESYLAREIYDVVACNENDRLERHETCSKWKERMTQAGFEQVPLYSEAKTAGLWGNKHKRVDKDGCVELASHSRTHIVASAWTVKPKENDHHPHQSGQTHSNPLPAPIRRRPNV